MQARDPANSPTLGDLQGRGWRVSTLEPHTAPLVPPRQEQEGDTQVPGSRARSNPHEHRLSLLIPFTF